MDKRYFKIEKTRYGKVKTDRIYHQDQFLHKNAPVIRIICGTKVTQWGNSWALTGLQLQFPHLNLNEFLV
jgi:hypothetical protein